MSKETTTTADEQARGEFPDCGCHYTTDDDGIHFCQMHKAAPELLAACKSVLQSHQISNSELQRVGFSIGRQPLFVIKCLEAVRQAEDK